MADVSNYGPVRRLSPPVPADNRKPYFRTGLKGVLGTLDLNSGDVAVPTTPDSPYYPFHVETPQLEPPSQNHPSVPDGPRDIPGFPTYEQYQRIEEEYLSSLSDRKQPKALISQNLFDKIYAVLQNGSEDRASTAQFRFWVRKMFVLAYPQTSFNHHGTASRRTTPEPVVLHDKRPVAIKEQLYEVLCYCHAISRHGGRDKTCATLRIHYSWVPKELTAKFVKACPTCTLKRSGNPDLLSHFNNNAPSPYVPQPPASSAASESATAPLNGGPNDTPPAASFVESSGCESVFTTPDLSVYPSPTLSAGSIGPTTPSPFLHSGLFGYPAVFDPGHSSLSSVASWDPSPSPCDIPGYASATATDEMFVDALHTHGLQLHLPTPTPKELPRIVRNFGRVEGDGGLPDETDPEERSMPCVVNANIDPALFMMQGYRYPPPPPSLQFAGHQVTVSMRTDKDESESKDNKTEDMDQSMQSVETEPHAGDNGTAVGGSNGSFSLRLLNASMTTWDTPTSLHAIRAQQQQQEQQLPLTPSAPSSPPSPSAACYTRPSLDKDLALTRGGGRRPRRRTMLCSQQVATGPPSASSRTRTRTDTSSTGPSSKPMIFAPAPIHASSASASASLEMEVGNASCCAEAASGRAAATTSATAGGGYRSRSTRDSTESEEGKGGPAKLEGTRWDRPEAWLVPSDSV